MLVPVEKVVGGENHEVSSENTGTGRVGEHRGILGDVVRCDDDGSKYAAIVGNPALATRHTCLSINLLDFSGGSGYNSRWIT
jgi:hypothetical protein